MAERRPDTAGGGLGRQPRPSTCPLNSAATMCTYEIAPGLPYGAGSCPNITRVTIFADGAGGGATWAPAPPAARADGPLRRLRTRPGDPAVYLGGAEGRSASAPRGDGGGAGLVVARRRRRRRCVGRAAWPTAWTTASSSQVAVAAPGRAMWARRRRSFRRTPRRPERGRRRHDTGRQCRRVQLRCFSVTATAGARRRGRGGSCNGYFSGGGGGGGYYGGGGGGDNDNFDSGEVAAAARTRNRARLT